MNYKRVTLLCGHYGSGKTNIAVNMALELKKQYDKVAIADLDIVNPYFRTKDSKDELDRAGIWLISSQYANTNLDAPALPQEMYAIVDDPSYHMVVDVGGDDTGAVALGRISGAIAAENDYDMIFVMNKYRPLTPDADSAIEIMREIEYASRLKFTALINNSNLAAETAAEDVLVTAAYAEEISKKTGLPLIATTVEAQVCRELEGKLENLMPLKLQKRPV